VINVAILGHGVVGSGVAELLMQNSARIEKNAGQSLRVKRILDLREFPDLSYAELFTKDFNDILYDDEIGIVAEMMGGLSPAYDYVKSALEKGKHVVTSNKELVAAKGAELLAIAKEKNVNFFFEASVAGGIPIIRPLHNCLGGNNINEVYGILNGTTNFILTKMFKDSASFDDALKEAQELGYAERDPSADVEGLDACRKICILASLVYGKHVYPKDVYTEGITAIDAEDVAYAAKMGYAIKLIGRAKQYGDKADVFVRPCMVPNENLLSGVNDVYNGVIANGDAVENVLFMGRGAGKFPTASAVVGDMVDIAQHPDTSVSLSWVDDGEDSLTDHRSVAADFYLRTDADVKAILPKAESICSEGMVHSAYLVREITEAELDESLKDQEILSKIRLL